VPGIFAAGEAAGGLHGANRLAGHGLVEGQVMGALAGESAARFAGARPKTDVSDALVRQTWERFRSRVCAGNGATPAWRIKDELAAVMRKHGGYVRSQEGLELASGAVDRMEAELAGSSQAATGLALMDAIEARHLIVTARQVLGSAMARKESRGAHIRSDFSGKDDDGFRLHMTASTRKDGTLSIGTKPVGSPH
jgi:fumarate reductase (CoM/CoB) subunit A